MKMITLCPSSTTSESRLVFIYFSYIYEECVMNNIKINIYSEKYAEGHGILEFSTDKAGQDVTPMNLKFDDEAIQNRGSTLNSISGEYIRISFI